MFEKNLDAIDNIALKRRLARISPIESRAGVSYCVTPSNDYVLIKDDVPSDDLNNPRESVRKMLNNNIKHEMGKNDIIITFGIGLGYLLDETFNTYPSRIFIYEPDLNLLHFVLNNVDISEHLASGRVYVTNDLNELLTKLSSSYITKDKVEIVYLQNYAVLKNKELLVLTQKVFDTCKSKMVDVNTITKFSKKWMINTIHNVARSNSQQTAHLLSDLENKFVGQTALIAAAGPSLSDNISKIQANRDKFVIFAVNKVAKYLIQNGIYPDFIVCLDAKNMRKSFEGIETYLNKSNCIMDVRTDTYLFKLGFNKIFMNFSETDFFMKKLYRFNNFIKFYESGGSASTLALAAAVKLGFSKIILSGLDLAFKDNLIYSGGETMQRVSQTEIMVDDVKKNLVQVRSVNGSTVYTREDYETFIYHIGAMIKELDYSEIYNTSTFGAYINGVKNTTFDNLNLTEKSSIHPVDFVKPYSLELKDFMQEEFMQINNIISMISKGVFSPALLNTIVKSSFIYQYMQSEVLEVLQKNFAPELAKDFIYQTKASIKKIVELLQACRLI